MSILVSTVKRSDAMEWMDDFELEGENIRSTLDQLAGINKWLGGNRISVSAVAKLLNGLPKSKLITINDMGCGHGNLLRIIADWGRKNNRNLVLKGIDANLSAINYGIELSSAYPEISYVHSEIEELTSADLNCDIAIGTLFFHHFDNLKIVEIIKKQLTFCRIGLVVNDLHRHRLAYYLFKGLCLFISNRMIKNDGLISVLRGFKRKDLVSFTNQLNGHHHIKWKWAFRYQWTISI